MKRVLQQGLPERFASLFRTHYPTVLRKLMYLVGDRTTAEDLAQEVFVRLYRRPSDDLSAVGAWLHRVATNVAYDYARQKSQQKRALDREFQFGLSDTIESSSELRVLQNAERETVKRVLQQMTDRDRQALLLRYSGYSYSEIAEIIGVNPNIMGTLVSRALSRFKRLYSQEEGCADEGQFSKGYYTI